MKYQMTDFFQYEQPLINQLRKEGKYVYGMRDCGGIHWSIAPRVRVNRIGFIITDEELEFDEFGELFDEDFLALGGTEVFDLKKTKADITKELEKSKAEWDAHEAEREAQMKAIFRYQNNRLERSRFYKLTEKQMHPEDYCKKLGIEDYTIVVQSIESLDNDMQSVLYFIKDNANKICIDSTKIELKRNCRYSTILKAIAKKHGIRKAA